MSTAGRLTISSLSRARKIKRDFGAVITLEDPGVRPSQRLRFHRKPAPTHLVLPCEDVDDDTLGIRVATEEQVADAIEFARRHSDVPLLIHCLHGVGRSAAIGLAVLADRFGASREDEAVTTLFDIRPEATPNLIVTQLADALLSREGALIAALARWEAAHPVMAVKRTARLKFAIDNPHLYARIT